MSALVNLRVGALALIVIVTLATSAVQSEPFPGVASGSSANAGAFSSSGTAINPGPNGSGSFVAQSGFAQDFSKPEFRNGAVGGSAGGFTGGYAGGYSGGSVGSSAFPFAFAPIPFPYFGPPQGFDFSSFFQNYINSIQRYHAQLAANAQKAAADQGVRPFPQYPDSFGNELGPVGAASFGQYGPQGGYGVAGVFPPPGVDNRFGGIDNRFGGQAPVSQAGGPLPPPGGSFYGISSFSSSGQSDINGKKDSFKQSSVTVNDNGKVTTYQAHDP